MLVLVCIILAFLSYWATEKFIAFAESRGVLIDVPNHRSSHEKPVVRGAGIIFVGFSIVCWIIVALLSENVQLLVLSFGASILAMVSFTDDALSVSAWKRFLSHVAVSILFLSTVPVPNFLEVHFGILSYCWYFFALFFMVSVINLYNFMDGIDGLLSLQGASVLAVWCVVSYWSSGYSAEYFVCAVAAASIAGFLVHNWKPATVFMGDVGSTFIGYTIASLAIVQAPGIMRTDNFFVLVILMLPVLFDATFTLIVRFLRGDAWYKPHRRHLFQRLIRAGYSHATVSAIYGLMTAFLGLVLLAIRFQVLTVVGLTVPLFICPFIFLYAWVRYAEAGEAASVLATKS